MWAKTLSPKGGQLALISVVILAFVTLVPQDCLTRPQGGTAKRRVGQVPLNSHHQSQKFTSPQVDQHSLNKWITSSLKFLDFHRCTLANIASEDECFKLSQVSRSEIAVYLGWLGLNSSNANNNNNVNNNNNNTTLSGFKSEKSSGNKVYSILPDSNSPKASGPHDLVLALDPYPLANFGHLVALFYIDFGQDARFCKEDYQIYTSDETCITVGKKPRCPNLLERFTSGVQPKRCHIDFLPVVYSIDKTSTTVPSGQPGSNIDLLECIPLSGFAPCPELRPREETEKVLCDSSTSNSKRCDSSHTGVGTKCKLFQTCDRAVLLGGGWNRMHSPVQSYENIMRMETALKRSGFLAENIKTFFANGKLSSNEHGKLGGRLYGRNGDYFSSAMKTGLRGHLRTMCETRHCADTLFLYLNNPTTIEGDMLLWDVDYNGMADELEVYTVKELLSDLSSCEAKRVLIVADQSNTDILMASLKASSEHRNVILFTAGLPNQIPTNGEFTRIWANNSHPINCLKYVEESTSSQMNDSNPVVYDPSNGVTSKLSLIGTPCDLNPPVSSRELKSLYQGCQNVPTSIWFSFNFENIGDIGDSEDSETDEEVVGDQSGENSPRRVQTQPQT